MPKFDFNKVAVQLYWNRTSALLFSCKFSAYFQNTFSCALVYLCLNPYSVYNTGEHVILLVNVLLQMVSYCNVFSLIFMYFQ